jgi:hypothetical protein
MKSDDQTVPSITRSNGVRYRPSLGTAFGTVNDGKRSMKKTKKGLTPKDLNDKTPTESERTPEDETGITAIGKNNALERSSAGLPETQLTDSLTPFPNIDQVASPSTNLIDGSVKQLKGLMDEICRQKVSEENLFKSVNTVNAAVNCAKQITGLLRLKLDIFKAYHSKK